MPVEPGDFDDLVVTAPVAIVMIPSPTRESHDAQINYTGRYVQSVEARDHEKRRTELCRTHRVAPGTYAFFHDQLGPLESLHTDKRRTQTAVAPSSKRLFAFLR